MVNNAIDHFKKTALSKRYLVVMVRLIFRLKLGIHFKLYNLRQILDGDDLVFNFVDQNNALFRDFQHAHEVSMPHFACEAKSERNIEAMINNGY